MKTYLKVLFLTVGLLVIPGVFGQGHAAAAYGNWGNGPNMPFTNDYNGNNVSLVVSKVFNGNSLNAPSSLVKVYSTSQNLDLDIYGYDQCNRPPDNDSNTAAPSRWSIASTDAAELPYIFVAGPVNNGSGTCVNDLNTPVKVRLNNGLLPNNKQLSGVPGHGQFYVFQFRMDLLGDAVNGFKLKVNTPGSYIGFSGASGYQFAMQNRSGGAGNFTNFNIPFSGACKSTDTTAGLTWYDDDRGTLQQNGTAFYFEVFDQTSGQRMLVSGPGGQNNVPRYYPQGGSGNPNDLTVSRQTVMINNFIPKHKYIWQWAGVVDSNGIQFKLPYDSINFTTTCPTTTGPPTVSGIKLTDNPGDPVEQVNIVSNASGNYPFADDRITAKKSNTYVDSSKTNSFNFPSSLPAGGGYTFTVADEGTSNGPLWSYLGYTICNAADAACDSSYLNNSANLRLSNYVNTLATDQDYNMRLIYHKNVPVNNAPSMTITADCSNQNAHVVIYDADSGPTSVFFSINGGGYNNRPVFVSGGVGYTDIPMSSYNQFYTAGIDAYTYGVTPSGADQSNPAYYSVTYGQVDGSACRVNNPPSISSSRDCNTQNVTINVSDADPGTATVFYKIDGGGETAVTSNSFNIDMSDAVRGPNYQYDPHIITARTTGVNVNSPPNVAPISPDAPTRVVYGKYPDYDFRACVDRNFIFTSATNLNLNPDEEAPISADSSVVINLDIIPDKTPLSVTTSVDRYYYLDRGGVTSALASPTPVNVTLGDGISSPPLTYASVLPAGLIRGDKICIRITLTPQKGLVGSDGTVTPNSSPDAAEVQCQTIVDKPYFRVYGGDIRAGGSFTKDRVCKPPLAQQGSIVGQYRLGSGGAATELANIALIKVSGVASASLRTVAPTEPNGLTFANLNVPSYVVSPPTSMGGQYDAGNYCVPDYYTTEQFTDARKKSSTSNNINVSTGPFADGEQTVVTNPGSRVKIKATSVVNYRHTFFIDNDVQIDSNIDYPSTVSSDPSIIPYITFVVRGNIYIDPAVTNLNGLFIAQPTYKADGSVDTDTGKIFTCRDYGGNPVYNQPPFLNPSSNNCTRKLTVTGAFIAQRIVLQRAVGSLRNAFVHEGPGAAAISESFQASPEYYFGKPVFRPQTNTYDSIKSLPPIL